MKALNVHHQQVRRTLLQGAFRTGLTVLAAGMALTFACNKTDKPALDVQNAQIAAPVACLDSLSDSAFIQAVLSGRIGVNSKGKDGQTALMRAAASGHEGGWAGFFHLLQTTGEWINPPNRPSLTDYIDAVRNGSVKTAKQLLELGADVNAKDSGGNAALMYAVRCENIDVVALLLENHADVNTADRGGWTVLMWAAYTGSDELWSTSVRIVKLLLKYDADVDAKDNYGYTAAYHAHSSKIVDILNEKMAK